MKHCTFLIAVALLISSLAGCSRKATALKVADLGVVEISSGTPIRHDLGGGKVCVIMPTVITNRSARFVKMTMVIEQTDPSGIVQTQACPSAGTIAGESVEWRVGDINIRLKTKIKP